MIENFRAIWKLRKQLKGQGGSIRQRLIFYWVCMALVVMSAVLLLVSLTGLTSQSSRQFGETLENQQKNNAVLLTSQMDTLTAKSISFSRQLGSELDGFLAARGMSFESLNDAPQCIEELESALLPSLKAMLEGTPCSGAYLCLDATANTSLLNSGNSRMGLYLRYSSLLSANPSGNVTYFRGAVPVAREYGIGLHNRWNMEIDTGLLACYEKVMGWSGQRLPDGCLWTEKMPLTDTWEDIMLLCVPIQDEAGIVRGVCGVEISDLYFTLSHRGFTSPYGSFSTLLVPMDGDTLLMERAMLGDTENASVSVNGKMQVKEGKYYDTFTCGNEKYLGRYQIMPVNLLSGNSMAVVTLVAEDSLRAYEGRVRITWIAGSLAFLAVTLAASILLSRSFTKNITESLAAVREKTDSPILPPSGIPEIDELLEFINKRTQNEIPRESLPPEIGKLIDEFSNRASTLTNTEHIVLEYYISGYATRDIPELMFISAGTAKAHNRNIYRKLGVSSYDELKAYIDVFQRCGKISALLTTGKN